MLNLGQREKLSSKTLEKRPISADKMNTEDIGNSLLKWDLDVKNDLDFQAIFKENKDKIFNFIFRMTGDYHLTEDIFQDVFLKAYSGISKFKGKSNISTWLYSIAINSIRDELRKKKLNLFKITYINEENNNLKYKGKTPEEEMIEKEKKNVLQKELNKLNHNMRAVLLLYYFEGISVEGISQITGKTYENVKVLLHRGRKTLNKSLKRAGYDF